MKVLSVQQPWASLICSGVKDIENRTWQPKEVPGRILIHASSKKIPRDYDMKYLLPEEMSVISNLKLFGICPDYDEMYYSSIIGYVDVVGFTTDSNSFWAGPDQIHWQLENAYLFDQPIQDVKGKLGLFDFDLDENSLPPAKKVEHNYPVLEGEHLSVHLGDKAWIILLEDDSVFYMGSVLLRAFYRSGSDCSKLFFWPQRLYISNSILFLSDLRTDRGSPFLRRDLSETGPYESRVQAC